MAGTVTRVTIYDRNIDRLFLAGGDVWDWMQRTGTEHLMMALVEAPMRTGALRRAHNLALTPYKKRGVRYTVGNYAEHSFWVHEGTDTPIVPMHAFSTAVGAATRPIPDRDFGGMSLRDRQGFPLLALRPWGRYGRIYKYAVRGQQANPWIARAADLVLSKYGYVDNPYPG